MTNTPKASDDPDVRNRIWAVAVLRAHAAVDARASIAHAIEILDEAGIFAPVDELNETDRAEALLAEGAARDLVESRTGVGTHDPLAMLRHWSSGA